MSTKPKAHNPPQLAEETPWMAIHNPDEYKVCEEDINDMLDLVCEETAYGYGDYNA